MEQQYNIREIVWAKVHPYPWWPGKIVKILEQNKKTVYKVSFFADPTYTFLHQSQLTPYLSFDHSLNDTYQHLPKLQKAIQMATVYYSRLTHKKQEDTYDMSSAPLNDFVQQQKREENVTQNIIFPQENNDQFQQKPIQIEQNSQDTLNYSEVTIENVLEIIEMNRKRQKSCGYSYENRKQEMQLQELLKKTLLMKYNLYDCATNKENKRFETSTKKKIIQITPQNVTSKQFKKICKQRSKNKHLLKDQIELLRVRCLRKIISILKESNQCIETSKIYAIKTMKRILTLAENNRIKFQSLFITLIKALTSNSSLQRCQQKLAEFNNYLEQLQSDKQEDQGSKITQIQAMN